MKKLLTLVLVAGITSGCATQVSRQYDTNYSIVDLRGVNLERYGVDYGECADYANQSDTQKNMVAGALAGALLGALVGASLGGGDMIQHGVASGVGAGAMAGATHSVADQQSTLRKCLAGRGYRVIR
jgi:outer membrane lipoprotein SlyB